MNPFKFYGSFTKPLPFPCLPIVFYRIQLQKIIFHILISVNQKNLTLESCACAVIPSRTLLLRFELRGQISYIETEL